MKNQTDQSKPLCTVTLNYSRHLIGQFDFPFLTDDLTSCFPIHFLKYT